MLRGIEILAEVGLEGLVDEGGFAAAAHAGDADEHAEGNLDGDILQVVAPGADDAEDFAIALPAFLRHLDLLLAVEESGGERVGLEHLSRRSLEDHLAAFPTGKGTHIDDVVGIEHHVFVVLDDDDGVALVAQLLERVDQPDIVALVQADTGFIQYIEYVDELGADLRGEPDALALAAAQCGRPAGEAEVVESDVEEELESGADFLDDLVGDGALLGLHLLLHRRHPCIEIRQFHVADLGDVLAVDAEMERLAVQSLATTFGTGDHLIDRLRPLLRPGLLLIDAQALHVGRHLLVIDALDINSRHDAETLAMGTGSLGRVEGEIVGRRVAVAKTGGGTHELFGEIDPLPLPLPRNWEGRTVRLVSNRTTNIPHGSLPITGEGRGEGLYHHLPFAHLHRHLEAFLQPLFVLVVDGKFVDDHLDVVVLVSIDLHALGHLHNLAIHLGIKITLLADAFEELAAARYGNGSGEVDVIEPVKAFAASPFLELARIGERPFHRNHAEFSLDGFDLLYRLPFLYGKRELFGELDGGGAWNVSIVYAAAFPEAKGGPGRITAVFCIGSLLLGGRAGGKQQDQGQHP